MPTFVSRLRALVLFAVAALGTGLMAVPTITQQPEVLTVRSAGMATFTVAATGSGVLKYQWSHAGLAIDGATGPALAIAAVTVADQGRYDVTVTDDSGSIKAQPGWLIFQTSPGLLWVPGSLFPIENGRGAEPMIIADDMKMVMAGADTSYLLGKDGSLWSMGANYSGQLGDGTVENRFLPVQVATGVVSVVASAAHALFITDDGALWGMGDNGAGQLGFAGSNQTRPVRIAEGVVMAAAGGGHSLWIDQEGALWAVGSSHYGQLGDGTTETRYAPVQVAGGVIAVTACGQHSLFLDWDGTLWGMGLNMDGVLGESLSGDCLSPVPIATQVRAVTTGYSHTLFQRSDGTLWGMGANYSGQLGDGTTQPHRSPVQIASGVRSMAAGPSSTFFVQADGSLWLSGAIYDNTATRADYPHTPVQIGDGVADVAAGTSHLLIRKLDGSVWAQGATSRGPLGIGATVVPSVVLRSSDAVSAAVDNAGVAYVCGDSSLWSMDFHVSEPVQVADGVIAASIGSLSGRRSYLKSDRTLWLFAPGDATTQFASDVVATGTGLAYDVFLKRDGTLWGRGSDWGIQFGEGTVPTQVATEVAAFSSACWHTLFTKTDRSLWGIGTACSGFVPGEAYGQWQSTAVRVQEGVILPVADLNRNLYLKTDGSLWQRGNGWIGTSETQVDSGVVAVAAYGPNPSIDSNLPACLYLKPDATLWSAPGVKVAEGVLSVSSGSCGMFAFIQEACFGEAPTITTPLVAGTVARGARVTLEVVVAGSGPLDYRWTKNGQPVCWDRSAQLLIPYAMPGDEGSYTVTVTNSAGSVTSTIELSVQAPPQITAQSTSVQAWAGGDAQLSVTSFGSIGTSCRWQVSQDRGSTWGDLANDAGYSGVGTTMLNLRGVKLSMDGWLYRCVLINADGSTTSMPMALVVVTGGTFGDWMGQSALSVDQCAPLATPAGDGVTNLMKFALGVSPLASAAAHLPAPSVAKQEGQPDALALLFTKNPGAQGIRYALEVSTNLVTWIEVAHVLEVLGTNPDGTQLVRLREAAPPAATRKFVRLKVKVVP